MIEEEFNYLLSEFPDDKCLGYYLDLSNSKESQSPNDFGCKLEIDDKFFNLSLTFFSLGQILDIFKFDKFGKLIASAHRVYRDQEEYVLVRYISIDGNKYQLDRI